MNLFYNYLINNNVSKDHIIKLDLDDDTNSQYWNPFVLSKYIRSLIIDNHKYYFFLDEIQKVISIVNPAFANVTSTDGIIPTVGFVDVLLGLMKIDNVEVYITGSNSKFLSSDILTEFRDRGDEIHIRPLMFSEYISAFKSSNIELLFNEYIIHGGMPLCLSKQTAEEKKTI